MQSTIEGVKLVGLAVAVPQHSQEIQDSGYATEKDRTVFSNTTGIYRRRLADLNVCTSDLCFEAAEALLKEAAWDRSSVDLLIFITQGPDYIAPATAITLQHRLGLSKTCAAFDINLGCSGYTYGLGIAASMMKGGGFKRALLLIGDVSSHILPSQVATTPPIFGDAGSATLLELYATAPALHFSMFSDGSGAEAIMHKYGCARHLYSKLTSHMEPLDTDSYFPDTGFQMDGLAVFNFTVREIPPSIRNSLAAAGSSIEAVDYFVFHQANKLINETLRKALKIPVEKYPYSLTDFGNTSSATIPLTLVVSAREALLQAPKTLLLSGFGIGLSWCNVLVQTSDFICPPLVEVP